MPKLLKEIYKGVMKQKKLLVVEMVERLEVGQLGGYMLMQQVKYFYAVMIMIWK